MIPPSILKALKRSLRNDDFDITTCGSAQEALELLEKGSFDVCVSDENMPGMTGSELMEIIKKNYSVIVRILLTGDTDTEMVKEAIESGCIFRFFPKPWDDFELVNGIRQGLKLQRLAQENVILKEAVKQYENLVQLLEKEQPGITSPYINKSGVLITNQ